MKIDGPGQGCAYSISKFSFPYPPQDVPLSDQSCREIWFGYVVVDFLLSG